MSGSPQLVGTSQPVRYRFGVFELEPGSGELRRNGVKLRLQEQPFLVLRTLLENAGDVVSREQLQAVLWPRDTFVDFDTSLNTAIKRLREALGDSADVPVFIETIPRRGYRFLAPIQVVRNGVHAPVSDTAFPAAEPPAKASRSWHPGFFVGALVLAAVAGGVIVASHTPAPLPRVLDSTQLTFDGRPKTAVHAAAGSIFFNERSGSRGLLLRVPESGGMPMVLDTSFPGLDLGGVSPDGAKLLVGNRVEPKEYEQVKIMDLGSGSIQDLAGVSANDASWAPGGKIVYAQNRDVFLADADGSHQHKLLTAPGFASFIRFSPDGRRMRFSIGTKHMMYHTIWEANADGSGLHELFTDLTRYPDRCCGVWSADGRYYFFQTTVNGGTRIWAQAEQKPFWSRKLPDPVDLTTVPPNYYTGAASISGNKLFVMAAQPRGELVRYDAGAKQFVPFLGGIPAADFETSRDGSSYVYVRYPEEALWRSNADGSEAAELTGPTLHAALPHWSPDGRQIAFAGMRPGKPWNIFVIRAQGGPAQQISSGALGDLDPTWSPDGKKIAFGELRQESTQTAYSIQLYDLEKRQQAAIPGGDGKCCPRWSPDGRYLVATGNRYDELLLLELATGKWTSLVKGIGAVGFPTWARDSKSITFDVSGVEEPAFFRVQVPDGRLERIADIGETRLYFGAFGAWTGTAPDGSPLLVRDISNQEIYSLDLQLP